MIRTTTPHRTGGLGGGRGGLGSHETDSRSSSSPPLVCKPILGDPRGAPRNRSRAVSGAGRAQLGAVQHCVLCKQQARFTHLPALHGAPTARKTHALPLACTLRHASLCGPMDCRAHRACLPLEFSRQGYWRGGHFLPWLVTGTQLHCFALA